MIGQGQLRTVRRWTDCRGLVGHRLASARAMSRSVSSKEEPCFFPAPDPAARLTASLAALIPCLLAPALLASYPTDLHGAKTIAAMHIVPRIETLWLLNEGPKTGSQPATTAVSLRKR